jgi:hypothetical protein
VLRWSAPEQLPRLDEIAIGPAVLFFAVTISLLSGVVFGLVPVLRFRAPTAVALRDSARGASEAPGRLRTRHALVVTQVALALVLLTVSGLMIRSFVAMRQVHPGFTRPAEVQTFQVTVPADATD